MPPPAAAPMRRPAAAPMRWPALSDPPAPSTEKWAEVLGLGLEFEANSYVNIVSRYTISPALASTLMGRPDVRDIGISTCEQARYAVVKVFNNLDSSIYGGSPCAGDWSPLVEKIITQVEHKDSTFHFHVAGYIHLSDMARLIYTATSMIHVRSSGICTPGNEFSSNYSVVYASACLEAC